MNILGVSALYHDSAACLVRDGRIVAAAQEERFTRKKGDADLPRHAMRYCLDAGGVNPGHLDAVVFYDKPLTKFTRLLTTYAQVAPRGFKPYMMALPVWLKEKAWAPLSIERFLAKSGHAPKQFLFTEHHQSHAASAFFPSPFDEAAILTVDGVGEWTSTAIGVGEGNRLDLLFEQRFPHSIGMLYSAFTYFTGFRVNSGEYKLMGLAPYGEPRFVDQIKQHLIDIREDGSFRLNLKYFGYLSGLKMTNQRFAKLFGGPPRNPESEITTREMDLARSIQVVTEDVLLKMARYARSVTGKRNLCLAGGVALNCVANGKILRSGLFDDLWIQSAAGDAGGALGAALHYWHHVLGNERNVVPGQDSMQGARLGPAFAQDDIQRFLDENDLPYKPMPDAELSTFVAEAIRDEKVIGLFQGRMEFGPRALGSRSIIADARSSKMQSYLNLATKFRESFRPFAPMVLREDVSKYFEAVKESPYMLLVDQVRNEIREEVNVDRESTPISEWVNQARSAIPAVTHVDFSARVQTVDETRDPRMYSILREFRRLTDCSVVVNTSFNVRSEPIVCTPEDAYVCFMRTGMDVLVLENCVLQKSEQPSWSHDENWQDEYALD